ncbi:MAG: hypothetical protein ACK40G_15295 [Cytophagaceae bacterium]
MKIQTTLFIFLIVFIISCVSNKPVYIPKTECNVLHFDVKTGDINGVKPDFSQEHIKEWFPCYTLVVADGSHQSCGGTIYYAAHGFKYVTFWDYVEIEPGFKGTCSDNLMGKNLSDALQYLGTPDTTRINNPDPFIHFFNAEYGCLRIHTDSLGTIKKIASHYYFCDQIEFCD